MTFLFSLVQALLFFSFIFSIMVQTKLGGILPAFLTKGPFILLFSLLDMASTFIMFFLLYYFLTPVRNRKLILTSTILATFFWYIGRYFFKYFILHIGKVTPFSERTASLLLSSSGFISRFLSLLSVLNCFLCWSEGRLIVGLSPATSLSEAHLQRHRRLTACSIFIFDKPSMTPASL